MVYKILSVQSLATQSSALYSWEYLLLSPAQKMDGTTHSIRFQMQTFIQM